MGRARTEIYTLSLHDALPICNNHGWPGTGCSWRPRRLRGVGCRGHGEDGRGVGDGGDGREQDRSQFGDGRPFAEAVEVTVEGLFASGLGLPAGAVEFGVGAVPGAFESGDLALSAGEEFGGGGVREEGDGEGCTSEGCTSEGCTRGFGEEGAEEIGLDALEADLLPIGAEHGLDMEELRGGLGGECPKVTG